MGSRYDERFAELRRQNRKAFIPFVLLGWPNAEQCLTLIEQMIRSGASALELGFAFSDPVADGPVIQQAAYETISAGFSVDNAFSLLKKVRQLDAKIPIGVLVYFNLVLKRGIEKFFDQAHEVGVDGVLIADLPIENADEILPAAQKNKIDPIFLISPLSPKERSQSIASGASGFIYLVSRLGVTGELARSAKDDQALQEVIDVIKATTSTPVCAGFGVSSPADAQSMFAVGADGIITGSKVIHLARSQDGQAALGKYYSEMLQACQQECLSLRKGE